MKNYSVAIDGPSGCGKSTVSKILANNNNLLFISSGIFYRVAGIFLNDEDSDLEIEKKLNALSIKYKDNILYVNDIDFSQKIFENKVSLKASKFAKNIIVRNFTDNNLRKMAQENDVIIDGRDIGTKVLPNANLKIFLSASILERTKRRLKELKNNNEKVNFIKIYWEIFIRDWNDKKRKHSPLVKAKDAIYVSTNNKTIAEVVDLIQTYIEK